MSVLDSTAHLAKCRKYALYISWVKHICMFLITSKINCSNWFEKSIKSILVFPKYLPLWNWSTSMSLDGWLNKFYKQQNIMYALYISRYMKQCNNWHHFVLWLILSRFWYKALIQSMEIITAIEFEKKLNFRDLFLNKCWIIFKWRDLEVIEFTHVISYEWEKNTLNLQNCSWRSISC